MRALILFSILFILISFQGKIFAQINIDDVHNLTLTQCIDSLYDNGGYSGDSDGANTTYETTISIANINSIRIIVDYVDQQSGSRVFIYEGTDDSTTPILSYEDELTDYIADTIFVDTNEIYIKNRNNGNPDIGFKIRWQGYNQVSSTTYDYTCDGAIELDETGAQIPVTYQWSGPDSYTSTSKNIYNLKAGDYNVIASRYQTVHPF